jgi:hypothetical protein
LQDGTATACITCPHWHQPDACSHEVASEACTYRAQPVIQIAGSDPALKLRRSRDSDFRRADSASAIGSILTVNFKISPCEALMPE